jgi:hypothetical protein
MRSRVRSSTSRATKPTVPKARTKVSEQFLDIEYGAFWWRGIGLTHAVFAGKDASRALAQSSLKEEDCRPDWEDLSDEHKKVLNDWYTFFSKRYNIKGKVEGATNT